MISPDCSDLFIRYFTFWPYLSQAEKELLCANTVSVSYPKGISLHSGSDSCPGVVLVKKGQLRVYMLSEEGREITLYRLFSGDTCILSASCVLDAVTFDVFIGAEEDSEVLMIPSPVFHRLAEQNIHVETYGYRIATERFSDVMWAMQQILFMGIDKRLAIFLLGELEKSGGDVIKLTHEQTARYMGTAREVVTRMLRYFADEKIVELSRGGIRVTDAAKLRALT